MEAQEGPEWDLYAFSPNGLEPEKGCRAGVGPVTPGLSLSGWLHQT